jgi:hypothetical protein
LTGSGKISSGNRYSSPAVPKLTKISFRPRFSTALTKVPSLGKRVPVFCDRIGLIVFNGSPGLILTSVVSLNMLSGCCLFLSYLFSITIFLFSFRLIIRRLKQASRFNQPYPENHLLLKQAPYQSENHYFFSPRYRKKCGTILTRFRFLPTG